MSTPYGSPVKRMWNNTPIKKNSNNITSFSDNNNDNNNFNNNDFHFEDNFLKYIKNIIPFFNKKLENLLIEYTIQYRTMKPSDIKPKNLINGILSKINTELINISNNSKYKNINNNNDEQKMIVGKTNKIITSKEYNGKNVINKIQKITHKAFIEVFINCVLYYYSELHNLNCIVPVIKLEISKNGNFHHIMEDISTNNSINTSVELGQYIISLFNSSVENKNKILFEVFKKIAQKLEHLQQICSFVHGDFHPGNIFIKHNKYNLNDIDNITITIIDFGFSVVKLPIINKNDCILASVEDIILKANPYINIQNEKSFHYKSIDLLFLIVYYWKLVEYDNVVTNYYNENTQSHTHKNIKNIIGPHFLLFKKFIKVLSSLFINKKIIEQFSDVHELFIDDLLIKLKHHYLYPENFIKFYIEDNKLKSTNERVKIPNKLLNINIHTNFNKNNNEKLKNNNIVINKNRRISLDSAPKKIRPSSLYNRINNNNSNDSFTSRLLF
jgi:hypothetical protein